MTEASHWSERFLETAMTDSKMSCKRTKIKYGGVHKENNTATAAHPRFDKGLMKKMAKCIKKARPAQTMLAIDVARKMPSSEGA